MKRKRGKRMARIAAAALVIGVFALLWPAQLGGATTMLTTVGTSMQPRIHEGDIALVRSAPPYQVGEVIAFRHGDFNQVALHRIVADDDGVFTTKGDNNDFLDSFHPTEADIVGRLWIHIPRAGKWLDWLRRPREAALATALLGLLIGTTVRQTRRRMRRRRAGQPVSGAGLRRRLTFPAPLRSGTATRGVWDLAALGAAGVLVLGLLLAALGLSRAPMTTAREPVPFRHTGSFTYDAPAAGASDTVPEGMRDGAPVFQRLANQLRVRFHYELEGERLSQIAGTYRLSAVVSDARGWRREMPLRAPAPFQGESFDVSGTLSLEGMRAVVERFREQTGETLPSYTLTLRAEVSTTGMVEDVPLRDTFVATLPFDADQVALEPRTNEQGVMVQPVQAGAVQRSRRVPAELRLWRLAVGVTALRQTGITLALLAALVLAVALTGRRHAPVERPSQRIQRRYGSRMLEVARVEPRPDERLVRMTGIKDLLRIAENLEAPILHLAEGDRHRYAVQEGDTTYLFEVDDTLGAEAAARLAPLPAPLLAVQTPPRGGGLPAPMLEIDLGEPLPPAGAPRNPGSSTSGGTSPGSSLPPAPPRRSR